MADLLKPIVTLPATRAPSALARLGVWVRGLGVGLWGARPADLTQSPAEYGASVRLFTAARPAGEDMALYAESPSVYAAVATRAQALARYPLVCAMGAPGSTPRRLDPERTPWAAALLRMLAEPGVDDVDALFPETTGEGLIVQLITDLLTAGVAYVRPVTTGELPAANVIGLVRLHPAEVSPTWQDGQRGWLHRPRTMALPTWYASGSLAVIRMASIGLGIDAWRPVGPLEPLRRLLQAEIAALTATKTKAEQGGPDIVVSPADRQMANFLASKEGREKTASEIGQVLSVEGGRRVIVLSGGLNMAAADFTPADLQGAETQAAAQRAAWASIGITPATLGGDASSYATAAIQQRAQYALDEAAASLLECYLLRPLARHFAARSTGMAARRADQATCYLDLSQHPGAIAIRSEALTRMQTWVALGWSAQQAADIEGLSVPPPAGPPVQVQSFGAPPAPPQPSPAPSEPREPVGGAGASDAARDYLGELFTRGEPAQSPVEEARALRWRAVETERAQTDARLQSAAQQALSADLARYLDALVPALEQAARHSRPRTRADESPVDPGDKAPVDYTAIDLEAALPPSDASLYLEGLGPDWLAAWEQSAANALDGTGIGGEVPTPPSSPTTLDTLAASSMSMADTSRQWVLDRARAGIEQGRSPQEIAADLHSAGGFSESRALTIARTETVRAQSDGANARYREAAASGMDLRLEWLSARDQHVRPEHRALDGQTVAVSGRWRFPGGVETTGPGLSGDPGQDCNCRCAVVPVV